MTSVAHVVASLHEREVAEAQRRLAELGVEVETVVGIGDPGKVIALVAEARGADLVVLGSGRVGRIRRSLEGSASSEVRR